MPAERFTSPVGRFVQGDFFVPQTTDQQGAPRVVKQGPNAGQPNPQFFAAVAFPKLTPDGRTNQEWEGFNAMLWRIARQDFPHLFDAAGQCLHPQFAWKVIDGDGRDTTGKANADKEGFAGHWVVRFSSSFQPKVFHAGRYAPQDQVQDRNAIKRGSYVRINGSASGNNNAQRPGLYLNLDLVEIAGYGPEITSGPDASAAFGGSAGVLPPGASATPVLAAPPAPGTPPAAPLAPPPAPMAPPVAPPAARVMLPAANGASYESLVQAGWTDALLVQHGMMAAPVAPPAAPPAAPMAPPPAPLAPTPAAPPPAPPPAPVAPPPAPVAPPPAPAPVRAMLPAANGASYESFIAAGWTDAQLVQSGMMAA